MLTTTLDTESPAPAAAADNDKLTFAQFLDACLNTWDDLEEAYNGTLEEICDEYLNAPEPIGTGIPQIDAALNGGLRPGVSVLGGEPGAGKSALALLIAFYYAYNEPKAMDNKSIYVSLEMSREQCLYRVCSLISKMMRKPEPCITPFAWSDAWKSIKDDNKRLSAARTEEEKAATMHDLTHGDNPYMTAARVFKERYAKRLIIAAGAGLKNLDDLATFIRHAVKLGARLFVIDYLQLIQVEGITNEYDRVTQVSNVLSDLGHELGIPILVLSSQSRAGATDTKNDIHSFKGSGSIEYDGECAMTLRGDNDTLFTDGSRGVSLKVVKNRSGAFVNSKPVSLKFDAAHNMFEAR